MIEFVSVTPVLAEGNTKSSAMAPYVPGAPGPTIVVPSAWTVAVVPSCPMTSMPTPPPPVTRRRLAVIVVASAVASTAAADPVRRERSIDPP
jgi:hypothetical protein